MSLKILKKVVIGFIILFFAILYLVMIAGFNMGLKHQSLYYGTYNDQTNTIIITTNNNKNLAVSFYDKDCGVYGLFGIIIPFIPFWSNKSCDVSRVSISSADKVYIEHDNNTYTDYTYNELYRDYIFSISPKVFKNGATLIIEKDSNTYKIPFKYQHTFSYGVSYQMWGRNKENNE